MADRRRTVKRYVGRVRLRLASWLLGDRDELVEVMWREVKTNGYDARTRARNALDAVLDR